MAAAPRPETASRSRPCAHWQDRIVQRPTFGCQLPEPTVRALRVLEHLNHKYALDGRDPNSYGGILWCFGLFDRPFYRRPIFGTVRYMSLKAAAGKFDTQAYIARFPTS